MASPPRTVHLLNPPSPGPERFAREGRCQERLAGRYGAYPPLTLARCAAVLHASGVPCALWDAEADRSLGAAFARAVGDGDLVVMATTTPTIRDDVAFAEQALRCVRATLVAIGAHATAAPAATLRAFPRLDALVVGEPELVLPELARAGDPRRVRHVAARGGPVPPRASAPGLDVLPQPLWGGLPLERYVLPLLRRRFLLVETSRGCPHGCSFCVAPRWHGPSRRSRSPEGVADEMASCRERLGVDSFVLFGESLADDREATLALCRAVVERAQGCRWVTNARADAVDAGLASALAGAGCALVALGLESGDQGVLERAGKGTAPEDARRAVRALRDAGVMSLGFFVLGLPGETERTARSTIELATSLDLDLAEFYPAVPFPGTPLAREVEARGVSLGPEAWPLLEYGRVHGLEGASALADPRGWARRAYLRFYADPARLGRLAALGGAGALGAACDWARSRLGP